MNQTLLSMFRTQPEEKKSNWKDSLNKLIHAYNCTRHEATGFSQFYLMFGCSPRSPVNLMFDVGNDYQQSDHKDCAKRWQREMRQAYTRASAWTEKSSARSKAYYNRKTSSAVLHPGDRVLVRNLSERGRPGKLCPCWEQQIHDVEERIPDSPVYRVKPEHGRCKQRVLHRNLLLPCDALPFDLPSHKKGSPKQPGFHPLNRITLETMERVLMMNMELRYRQHPLEEKASGNPPIDTTEQFSTTNCEDKSVTKSRFRTTQNWMMVHRKQRKSVQLEKNILPPSVQTRTRRNNQKMPHNHNEIDSRL